MKGHSVPKSETNPYFDKFYKMPNILNEPDTFFTGEEIEYSEKIHGTNARVGMMIDPKTDTYKLYVGSHNVILKQEEGNLYWDMMVGITPPKDIILFGEIFGKDIQKSFDYGRKSQDIVFYAGSHKGEYLSTDILIEICRDIGITFVKNHTTIFESVEQIRKIADLPSEYTDKHCREGIVIKSKKYPKRIAKCISFEYLTKQGRKERH